MVLKPGVFLILVLRAVDLKEGKRESLWKACHILIFTPWSAASYIQLPRIIFKTILKSTTGQWVLVTSLPVISTSNYFIILRICPYQRGKNYLGRHGHWRQGHYKIFHLNPFSEFISEEREQSLPVAFLTNFLWLSDKLSSPPPNHSSTENKLARSLIPEWAVSAYALPWSKWTRCVIHAY